MDHVGPPRPTLRSMPRLIPGVRGAFDEETCRMRLHEIGNDIVPRYPFADGIQEIYAILLVEYGRSQIADAVSVLHELLEDESYEGNIWRSWRHEWRHRNDDILNPFVPAVGDYIFPPPTSRAIRALRGANFSAAEEKSVLPLRRRQITHDENRPSYISLSQPPSHDRSLSTSSVDRRGSLQEIEQPETQSGIIFSGQSTSESSEIDFDDQASFTQDDSRSMTHAAKDLKQEAAVKNNNAEHPPAGDGQEAHTGSDNDLDTDSQQEYEDVTSNLDQVNDPNLLRFEMMTSAQSHRRAHGRSQSDPTGIVVLRPVHAGNSASDVGKDAEVHRDATSEYLEGRPGTSSEDQEYIDDETQYFLTDRAYNDDVQRMSLSAVKSYTVEKTSPSISTVSNHASLHSGPADELDVGNAHRRSSSILSNEFLSVIPREPASPTPGRYPIDGPDEESPESRRVSVLAGLKGTPPNRLIRRGRSFLKNMPKIFRKDRESKQTNQQSRHPEEDTSTTTRGLFRRKSSKSGWCSLPTDDSHPKDGPKPTVATYNFDGACDEDDTASIMSAVDLNKALPPQPPMMNHQSPVSHKIDTPSLTYSNESKPRPSITSTGSSSLSRVSSKKRFHRTANELVHHRDMEGSRSPSPLRELDSDKFLIASKYDPLASPKLPDTPVTFSSFNNVNPFMDQYEEFIPPMPIPAIRGLMSPDPMKVSRVSSIPQSRSEGQIYSPRPLKIRHNASRCQVEQSNDTNDHNDTNSRGRVPSRDILQATEASPKTQGRDAFHRPESRKRSRSPVKRFLGLGKSQSMKDIPQEKEGNDENDRKAALKVWGDRLRHGFMTNTESKANVNSPQPETTTKSHSRSISTLPISICPPQQAKILCELEFMLCVAANKFLLAQHKANLMSADSVSKIINQWTHKNRPQVVEFQFDQATQRDLILYNINTFRFHGESRTNPLVLNATMYAWKAMAKEMSVRTYCTPDSVIRKHLHDAHKVLEMLGANMETFLALQELQVTALKQINDEQKKKLERKQKREKEEKKKAEIGSGRVGVNRSAGKGVGSAKSRKFTPPTPTTSSMSAPMSVFLEGEETLFEHPYEG